MIITRKNLFNLSSFYYDIGACDFKRVGNIKLHPEVDFEWRTTPLSKFKHWSYSRFWCVKKGSAYVKTTFGEIELKEKTAYYIPQNTLLEADCEEYMEQYFVDFLPFSDFVPLENMFYFKNVSDDYESIVALMKDIKACKNIKDKVSEFKITAYMNAIMSHFIEKTKISHSKSEPFLQIIEQINTSYNEEISIAKLASSIGYNSEYFSRAFKATFGISPLNYITNKRVSVAKHLLLTTDLPIFTIASKCGFDDPLYFTKVFTRHIGFPPSTFRSSTKSTE